MVSYLAQAREAALTQAFGRREERQEFIAGVRMGRQDKVARRLEGLGVVTHVFECIPYVSFECFGAEAQAIAQARTRGYAEISSQLISLDVSSSIKVDKPSACRQAGVWNLEHIGVYAAWAKSTGLGVSVGVIDTGIDYTHPDLSARFGSQKGVDFVDGGDPFDRQGHGTHVAGIVAGANYGVATDSTLLSVRVLDAQGSGSEADVIAGIEWCVKKSVDVANISLGSPVASEAFEEMCAFAYGKGLVLVAAAGNSGGPQPSYPAAFGEPVFAVAATDRNDRRADFSSIWYTNDVSAPGVGIVSCFPGGGYAELSGTSMAAPHVSGAVALALPLLGSGSIDDLLEASARRLGDRDEYGAGLVRADVMVSLRPKLVSYLTRMVGI